MTSKIYLYVKQHKDTKLKYFGKTTSSDPISYTGSGTYWRNHIRKHGKRIETTHLWEFDDVQSCSEFALNFSLENNIVESNEWANLQPENGRDGCISGVPKSEETKAKMKQYQQNKPQKHLDNIRNGQLGRKASDELRQKFSVMRKGISYEERYGHERSEEIKAKASLKTKGRTYEERFGPEKAAELKRMRSESNRKRARKCQQQ